MTNLFLVKLYIHIYIIFIYLVLSYTKLKDIFKCWCLILILATFNNKVYYILNRVIFKDSLPQRVICLDKGKPYLWACFSCENCITYFPVSFNLFCFYFCLQLTCNISFCILTDILVIYCFLNRIRISNNNNNKITDQSYPKE